MLCGGRGERERGERGEGEGDVVLLKPSHPPPPSHYYGVTQRGESRALSLSLSLSLKRLFLHVRPI